MEVELNELVGKVLTKITVEQTNDDYIEFTTNTDEVYRLYHKQDCCESVFIDDICGDLEDLIGTPILIAEEVSNESFVDNFDNRFHVETEWGSMQDSEGNSRPESYTWTFYKFATINGYVDIRWFGQSNGYYSERVTFSKSNPDGTFGYYWD